MNWVWINIIVLWIVVLIILLLVLALIRHANQNKPQNDFNNVDTLSPGSKAPDFTAKSLAGDDISLENFTGSKTILIFVSPTCAPCKVKIPEIEKVRKNAESANVNLVYVCSEEGNKDLINDLFKGIDSQEILLIDKLSNSFISDYKVPATPFFCYLDENGIVKDTWFMDEKWDQIVNQWKSTEKAS